MSDKPDPLEEIRRMRAQQLRACALQQAADIERLHRAARSAAQAAVNKLITDQSADVAE